MIVLFRVEKEMGDLAIFCQRFCMRGSYWMRIGWIWKIGLEKRFNLNRVWELMGLMLILIMIVDEWLVFEGATIVVGVLLDCLVHMTFVCRQGNYCWSFAG